MIRLKSIYANFAQNVIRIIIKIFSPIVIPVARWMAFTGVGTDNCLKHGFLPVRIHYYQPIPDIFELKKRNIWDKVSEMRGINFDPKKN